MDRFRAGGARTAHPEHEQFPSEYGVTLKFSVNDPGKLWRAAAQRLIEDGLDEADIEDTIGPVDDPAIGDCLLAIAMPRDTGGCRIEEFDVHAAGQPPVKHERQDQSRADLIPVTSNAERAKEYWCSIIQTSAICMTRSEPPSAAACRSCRSRYGRQPFFLAESLLSGRAGSA